jgi:hypothetical protein
MIVPAENAAAIITTQIISRQTVRSVGKRYPRKKKRSVLTIRTGNTTGKDSAMTVPAVPVHPGRDSATIGLSGTIVPGMIARKTATGRSAAPDRKGQTLLPPGPVNPNKNTNSVIPFAKNT